MQAHVPSSHHNTTYPLLLFLLDNRPHPNGQPYSSPLLRLHTLSCIVPRGHSMDICLLVALAAQVGVKTRHIWPPLHTHTHVIPLLSLPCTTPSGPRGRALVNLRPDMSTSCSVSYVRGMVCYPGKQGALRRHAKYRSDLKGEYE